MVKHQIMEKLAAFDPILVGTIPIRIDTDKSDLDIVCHFRDKETFRKQLEDLFGNETGLFARGPKSMLEKYASVLHKNGIRTSMLDDMEKDRQEVMLLMLGRNYFIAKDFIFDFLKMNPLNPWKMKRNFAQKPDFATFYRIN